MKVTSLILAVFLVGCSTPVPVSQRFPDVPKEIINIHNQAVDMNKAAEGPKK